MFQLISRNELDTVGVVLYHANTGFSWFNILIIYPNTWDVFKSGLFHVCSLPLMLKPGYASDRSSNFHQHFLIFHIVLSICSILSVRAGWLYILKYVCGR